ncbi:hypothetical protein ZWY2020_010808 [Hordeum vulgare]|nr:hypothetical protein ZWY2020_010808 [Hordeum vulgare]
MAQRAVGALLRRSLGLAPSTAPRALSTSAAAAEGEAAVAAKGKNLFDVVQFLPDCASPAVPGARAAHSPEGPEHQLCSRRGRGGGGGEGEEDGFETDGDGRISPSELAAVSRAIAPSATESAGGREVASMMDELNTDHPAPRRRQLPRGFCSGYTPSCNNTLNVLFLLNLQFVANVFRAKVVDISENSLTLEVVVWFSTGYITIKDMVVTGMPIKIVGVAALTVLLPTLEDDP